MTPWPSKAMVTGDAVNTAARLEQSASPGEILIGIATYELVHDAVTAEAVQPLELKGKAAVVPAYRLLDVTPGAAGMSRRLDSPMVGRERQLGLLLRTFDQAVAERACHLFTILGAAGVGKSRLEQELVKRIGNKATILQGRCLSYGDGITFFPVVEVVKQAAGLADFDDPGVVESKVCAVLEGDEHQELACGRLAQLLGVSEVAVPDETFWAIRRMLEAVARDRPLLLVFDDIHWGEPTFLDLVEHIADWSRDAAILLVCLARPELLDRRPSWGGGKWNATTVALDALPEADSRRLLANLLGRAELGEETCDRIVAAAEGNPLFVEELLRMLIDEGLLVRSNGGWASTGELSHLTVPATIRSILAARLDQLPAGERAVIERASVIGKVFFVGAVQELTPSAERPGVPTYLMALVRKELVRPERSTLPGEDAFNFRHLLIRDAVYQAIPKELRAQLHEQFADWLERVAGDRVEEQEEIIGYHLEQALHYRGSLGPTGDAEAELARRAANHIAAAGRRSFARGDAAAGRLLHRAADLLPAGDRDRVALLSEAGAALSEAGEFGPATALLEEAIERGGEVGDEGAVARARLSLAELRTMVDPEGGEDETRRVADELIPLLERLGDELGLARAWRLRATAPWFLGQWGEMQEALEQSLVYARRAESPWEERLNLDLLATAITFGPTPAPEALRALKSLRPEVAGGRSAWVTPSELILLAMQGRIEEARRIVTEAVADAEALGNLVLAARYRMDAGQAEHIAGDLEAAERELRLGRDLFLRVGQKAVLETLSAHLAMVLCDLGRFEEAPPFVDESRELASSGDATAQMAWRTAQARVIAHRNDGAEAERLATDAVAIARQTDYLSGLGDALVALAEVVRLSGRPEDEATALREAIDLYERKGNMMSAARAGTRLDSPPA